MLDLELVNEILALSGLLLLGDLWIGRRAACPIRDRISSEGLAAGRRSMRKIDG